MITAKTARRPRRGTNRLMSDRRYYVQCAYRVTMALLSLVALIIVTTNH